MIEEKEICQKLLRKLTGNDIIIERSTKSNKFWTVNDNMGFLGVDEDLATACTEYVGAFFVDVLEYINESDESLDGKAQELKQYYMNMIDELD